MPPLDIPDVGKIAVFLDPQGAALGIIQPIDKPSNCSGNQLV
jgi:predicted enzyme related to lactoylglutathione lyase